MMRRTATVAVAIASTCIASASGCHLHFELWSAPGWYEGGHVLDPTRPLKKWDRYS